MGMHNLAMGLGKSALVLREKEINPEGPLYVRLVGRKSGFVAWLLTLIGINTTTTLEVYQDRIEYSYGSLSGRMLEMIPLSKVSNLMCGRFKPVILFLFAVIAFISGIFTAASGAGAKGFFMGLIIAAGFMVAYFLRKTILLAVVPNSASACAVLFKRSLIENHNISDEEAKMIIDIINGLVEQANR